MIRNRKFWLKRIKVSLKEEEKGKGKSEQKREIGFSLFSLCKKRLTRRVKVAC